jgi:uncharacterized membrane protein
MAVMHDPKTPGPCDVIDTCPICGGSMESVYSRAHQKVCVCSDCNTSITVPTEAWGISRQKGNDRR